MKSLTLTCIFISIKCFCVAEDLFPLTIIHMNDMHARFEETNLLANICKENEKCIGGFARVVTKVKELRAKSPNPIFLNAGDNFQGTYWYNTYKWNVTQYFLNLEPADAMTIGNHEFDDGISGLVPFLERIKIPVVSCNINATLEPKFAEKFNNSIILERSGRKIGIVGVTTTVPSGWGRAKVLPEVEYVRKEVDKLVEQGIKIIIVLSHAGLDFDREIAKHGGPIDLIVGGHTHSFLFSGKPVGPDKPVGEYPTIETQENGRHVLIVQASAFNKYLGNIQLFFDEDGEVKRYEGAPIFLSHEVPQDPMILEELKPWKATLDAIFKKPVGCVKHEHDSFCFERECGMGNLITDSMRWAFHNNKSEGEWTGSPIALALSGSVRAALSPGEVMLGDLFATTPFGNKLVSIELPGSAIRKALEFSVSKSTMRVLQVSGVKVVFDLSRKPFERIVNLEVLCQKCEAPQYEAVDDEKQYRVVLSDYTANGGDNFTMFTNDARNRINGPLDIDVLVAYVRCKTPIEAPPLTKRIQFL
ncbi:unnamed protein product [Chironomus riparius]|uniref:apyrase n=1 Tax=Chironomus riparius TaxID=315576 RepID=A0A9N9RJB7_9DIPT|nr:unnamed protein product [Chironomus riparius]